jgi:hypothetical protein
VNFYILYRLISDLKFRNLPRLQAQKQSELFFIGNISIISEVTGTLTYGIAACDVTIFPNFSMVMVSSRQNPVQQGTVGSFVPNEAAKPQKIQNCRYFCGKSCETRSIDTDIAGILWHRARQRDSSLQEVWLCWEFGSYLALVMLHTFNYA